jgi:predicted CoA-binding protein
MVDVFLRSKQALPIAEEAIEIGAKPAWMQEGKAFHLPQFHVIILP